ncbi:recombinase family protein [Blastococcus mobilis]|uniref:Site-specific DNA recombinase n=1 Tax=Blastococcus mobilis TaxID=1938746 RepID=A0A239AIC1_9ACTN|nr:recombinase family protein [Blastococcus mobilis]SNR95290.1 Site-specific DNA recombinase [Blastococcus mobilis]
MATRCAIYARQSLDRSGEGAAVERQIADCRRLAEARGWAVEHVLTDNDLSASTGKPRPQYERLLNLMLAGQVEAVVVWHVDRLTRRLVDLEQIITACESVGIRLATVTGDLDLGTDTGRMLARILASVARGEVERKGTRQRAANRQRAEAGRMGWTRRPFGYDVDDDGKIVVVEAEAEGLRAAAGMVLGCDVDDEGRIVPGSERPVTERASLAAAARMLNDTKGLPTTGRRVLRDDDGNPRRDDDGRTMHGPFLPWNTTTMRRTLLNPRYGGRVTYNGLEMDADGTWPAILDGHTQSRLVEVLRDVKRRQQSGTEAKYLLSGLARCGRCGAVMFATNALMTAGGRRTHYGVYRCRACYLTRRRDLVDEVVEGVLLARMARPDAAGLLAPAADLDALRAEAIELRDRRDTLAGLLADGLLSRESVTEQAGKLTRRLGEVEGRITAALGDSPAAALVGADDPAAVWVDMDVRARKLAVDTLMTVTIEPVHRGARFSPKQVRIGWKGAAAGS